MATFIPAMAGASAPILLTAGALGAGAYMGYDQVPGAEPDRSVGPGPGQRVVSERTFTAFLESSRGGEGPHGPSPLR